MRCDCKSEAEDILTPLNTLAENLQKALSTMTSPAHINHLNNEKILPLWDKLISLISKIQTTLYKSKTAYGADFDLKAINECHSITEDMQGFFTDIFFELGILQQYGSLGFFYIYYVIMLIVFVNLHLY
eukprot:GHVN01095362.1.p1 GENE.GHVN01095362.1~~GHVN01095362.1.p1  ORF type:complete len:129 (+),score=9.37 GHVN01095362.1:225-611(+)